MRLWSIHPKYLDSAGLVALWREGLLAMRVLDGGTKGYARHPQLERFRAGAAPRDAIRAYLAGVLAEAERRGYSFDGTKLGAFENPPRRSAVPEGQARFEWGWILGKTAKRNPAAHARLEALGGAGFLPEPHPFFRWKKGGIASWERGAEGK